jgi:hypothetical protein
MSDPGGVLLPVLVQAQPSTYWAARAVWLAAAPAAVSGCCLHMLCCSGFCLAPAITRQLSAGRLSRCQLVCHVRNTHLCDGASPKDSLLCELPVARIAASLQHSAVLPHVASSSSPSFAEGLLAHARFACSVHPPSHIKQYT